MLKPLEGLNELKLVILVQTTGSLRQFLAIFQVLERNKTAFLEKKFCNLNVHEFKEISTSPLSSHIPWCVEFSWASTVISGPQPDDPGVR